MADIKTRTVDKTSIKTMDQSISASHRIRDAGAEIKHAGRQEIDSSEQSVSEYSTARFENAIHRTVAKAEHAAERGFDKGTWIAQHKMREHGIKERFKVASAKEAEDMATATTVKSRASVSRVRTGIKVRNSDAIKNRQNIKMRKDAKKAYTKSQEAMKATAKNSYRTAKAGSNAIKRISHSVAHAARALYLNTKVLVSAIERAELSRTCRAG